MHTEHNFNIEFLKEAPSAAELKYFFEDAGWQSSDVFITQSIKFKPHALLNTIWIRLNQKGQKIGMARLYLPPKKSKNAPAFIADVIIDSQHQRQGYGEYLIKAIAQFCKQKGVQLLVIEPNAQSINFWISIGFSPREPSQGLLFRDASHNEQHSHRK